MMGVVGGATGWGGDRLLLPVPHPAARVRRFRMKLKCSDQQLKAGAMQGLQPNNCAIGHHTTLQGTTCLGTIIHFCYQIIFCRGAHAQRQARRTKLVWSAGNKGQRVSAESPSPTATPITAQTHFFKQAGANQSPHCLKLHTESCRQLKDNSVVYLRRETGSSRFLYTLTLEG